MDNAVTSHDGTSIAYERTGSGPAVILVGGGLDDGAENAPLAPVLGEGFTVYNYARRGRGRSGDTLPYALRREIEDLDALIAEAGGTASLFGASSGGALVLEAAAAGLAIERLAVYEVPYCLDPGMQKAALEFIEQLHHALDEGRRGDALELFMRLAGSSDSEIAGARASEYWAPLSAIAHTLAYDAACMNEYRPPVERLAVIAQPALVLTGGTGPADQVGTGGLPADFFDASAAAIAAALPSAERRVATGQGHVADPAVLGPILSEFFTG